MYFTVHRILVKFLLYNWTHLKFSEPNRITSALGEDNPGKGCDSTGNCQICKTHVKKQREREREKSKINEFLRH